MNEGRSGEPRRRKGLDAAALELAHGGHRISVGEHRIVAVVGGPARDIRTHHDASSAIPLLSWKYTDRMISWSTTGVTSHPAARRRLRSISSACSSGTLNER